MATNVNQCSFIALFFLFLIKPDTTYAATATSLAAIQKVVALLAVRFAKKKSGIPL